MPWARRVDGPHQAIVKALRKVGCQVFDTSRVGHGFPDLVVRAGTFRCVSGGPSYGKYLLLEVKTARGRLTPEQKEFRRTWPEVAVVRSVAEALTLVGIHT